MLDSKTCLDATSQSSIVRVSWSTICPVAFLICLLVSCFVFADEPTRDDKPRFQTKLIRGRVVFLHEAMERLHKIKAVPEAKERTLALETDDGKLLTIVEDLRGRSFRTDDRLRKMHVELFVRKYHGSDAIQILKVFEIKDDKRFIVDYWCDICAIIMFEMGTCDCCQDDNRLRKRITKD